MNEILCESESSWLYHATTLHNLWKIASGGLRAGSYRRANFGGYGDHSKGKIFFAMTPSAAIKWAEALQDALMQKRFDDDLTGYYDDECWTVMVIRIPGRKEIEIDSHGDPEIGGSVFSRTKRISPNLIQFWNPNTNSWMPLKAENLHGIKPSITEPYSKGISEVALPKTVRDAYAILHAAGYREIGRGNYSRVYAKRGDNSVLKLFAPNDVAFKTFVGFTKSHPSPHFPKFSSKVMNIGQYSAIRTERLGDFEGNYDNIQTYILSNYYKATGENYSVPAYYLENSNAYMERQPSLKKAADELISFAVKNKFQPDIKRKNLMLRGDTIVFIDPICGGTDTDDRGLAHVTAVD